ncbi:MAG: helix-turn-helix domain-containing protein [Gammaproteobacteria bacterium]|nr:helix-turn-helix domain-containing protein [Gammaproteobacteria bacterium]
MRIDQLLTDQAILNEWGTRLAKARLDRQLTQAQLAEQAGVSKRTVERIEAGTSAQLSSLIRVLRVLGLLTNLEQAIPDVGPRPIDLLERKGKQRKRATGVKEPVANEPWSWDDE